MGADDATLAARALSHGSMPRVLPGRLLAALLLAWPPRHLPAQPPPHLALDLRLERAAGVIAARACLSRLPERASHQFILHRGLNVRSIRDAAGRLRRHAGEFDGRVVGEGIVYRLIDSAAVGDSLCVEYGGAFPVYRLADGDFSATDYKGSIAFHVRSVRATEQSKWYPIPFDSARGAREFQAMTFQARVRCADCRTIYLNGDAARPGPAAEFRSDLPVPLLLFAGDVAVEQRAGIAVLNGTPYPVTHQTIERVAAVADSIRQHYERWLGVRYGLTPVFMQHTITEDRPRRRWGFVSYPTIAFSNDGLTAFVDSSGAVTPMVWPYLGHEMAHYYFGTLVVGRGPYSWFLVESVAEYLALSVVRRFQGDSAFRARVAGYGRTARRDSTSVAFDRITSPEQLHERYRYELGPLLLVALEDRVGAAPVRRLLANVLEQPGRQWDYQALRSAAGDAGIAPDAWRDFEVHCVRPPFARGCLAAYADAADAERRQ